MNLISQMFSKIGFKLFFLVGSTSLFYILPEFLNNSWWFSSSFSTFEDRRRISLKSCSILFKIHDSSLMPSFHNCFDCENSFHPSGAFHELFPFLSSEGHHVIILHSQHVAIVLQILPVHRSNIL